MIRAMAVAVLVWAAPAAADPVFSIAGTMAADGNYDTVLAALKDAHADATTVSLFWDQLEVNGTYAPPLDWPAIADAVYPGQGLQVSLMISVLDTTTDRRPADLLGLAYDDPVVIARFTTFLTEVLTRMPNVTLTGIGIGNEVDGVLRGDDWAAYGRFFQAAQKVAHQLRPDVPVGMTITWGGLSGPDATQARAMADLGDIWMVNYYPLLPGFEIDDPANLPATLDAILTAAGHARVALTEVGYPSGGCGASEAGQLAFVQGVLAYGAAHSDRISLISLDWLHDLSADDVAGYVGYYGVGGDCFAAYLGTLGLRHADATDKPAFEWLRQR